MKNIDLSQIIKVISSAGGGKTTELSNRFIYLLKKDPDSLNNILAITFTNRAANEMKQRILKNLKEKALKGDKKYEEIVEKIINNFSDFSVKTISSFTYSLIKAFQFELGINFETEVKLNKEIYFEIAFERLIEKAAYDESLKKIFLKYANFYNNKIKSLYFWNNIYKNLSYMLIEISNKRIKLEKINEVDIDHPLFFTYCFHNLIEEFKKYVNEVEKDENIILLEKFGDYISKIYESSESSIPFVYYKIGSRFKHILIDEFQDTSTVDWENIYPIVENTVSEGGTFFYVGDPKQSIYQWRGGDPTLFDKVFNSFKNFNRIENKLMINYRSRENIIKLVQEIFKMEEIKNLVDKVELSSEYLKDCDQYVLKWKEKSGYVVIRRKEEKDIENAVIGELNEILKRWNFNEVAILTRKNQQSIEIAKLLSKNGIPYIIKENLNVLENNIVREIISLLRFINSPYDNISFFNFITGKCFFKITGIQKEKIIESLLNFSEPMFEYFKKIFKKEWENFILPFIDKYIYLSVYELIIEFIKQYRVYENFPEEIGFVEGFLEYIYKLEENGMNLPMILDEIEFDKVEFKQGIQEDGVFISTIHNVKGLEFPVVFIPYLKYGMKTETISKNFFVGDEYKKYVRLSDKKKSNMSEFDYRLESEYIRNAKSKFEEELNILYVAITRAKDEIYIYYVEDDEKINLSFRGLGNIWNKIFNIYMRKKNLKDLTIGIPLRSEGKKLIHHFNKIERKTSYDQIFKSILFKSSVIEDEEIIGEAFHKVLEISKEINKENLENAIDTIVNRFFPKYKKDYYRKKLKQLVNNLLSIDNILEILNKKNVYIEKWGYDDEGLIRMDRVIIDDKKVYVVDFKTGKETSMDKMQIERYKRFLKKMYNDKEIKGFLIYVKEKEILEV